MLAKNGNKTTKPELIYCAAGNKRFAEIAIRHGMTYGAQLPNTIYYHPDFVDQDWRNPKREKYMDALKSRRPRLATVLDLEYEHQFEEVISWAHEAAAHVKEAVLIIPKVKGIIHRIPRAIEGKQVRLAYSVMTSLAGTEVPPSEFGGWPVHLLGGSPLVQMRLSQKMTVVSTDGNYAQKMAVERNQFFAGAGNVKAKNRFWPKLDESVFGYVEHDTPYKAFELSMMNIKSWWAGCAAMIRHAIEGDLRHIKRIANQYRDELGHVMYPALRESINRQSLYVAEREGHIVGFVNFRLRRDGGITIYEIAADKQSRGFDLNIGSGLIAALPRADIRLKCTVDNPANAFYEHQGFTCVRTEDGRKRRLNVWVRCAE